MLSERKKGNRFALPQKKNRNKKPNDCKFSFVEGKCFVIKGKKNDNVTFWFSEIEFASTQKLSFLEGTVNYSIFTLYFTSDFMVHVFF